MRVFKRVFGGLGVRSLAVSKGALAGADWSKVGGVVFWLVFYGTIYFLLSIAYCNLFSTIVCILLFALFSTGL